MGQIRVKNYFTEGRVNADKGLGPRDPLFNWRVTSSGDAPITNHASGLRGPSRFCRCPSGIRVRNGAFNHLCNETDFVNVALREQLFNVLGEFLL